MESRPPEMPILSGVPGGSCSIRLASPAHWMPKISAQRRCSSGPPPARTACPARRASGRPSCSADANGTRRNGFTSDGPSSKLVVTRRSVCSLATSTSWVIAVRVAADRLAVADAGRLGQQTAVLGDQAVAAEDHVGRRFRWARCRPSHKPRSSGPTGRRPDRCDTGSCRSSRCWPTG